MSRSYKSIAASFLAVVAVSVSAQATIGVPAVLNQYQTYQGAQPAFEALRDAARTASTTQVSAARSVVSGEETVMTTQTELTTAQAAYQAAAMMRDTTRDALVTAVETEIAAGNANMAELAAVLDAYVMVRDGAMSTEAEIQAALATFTSAIAGRTEMALTDAATGYQTALTAAMASMSAAMTATAAADAATAALTMARAALVIAEGSATQTAASLAAFVGTTVGRVAQDTTNDGSRNLEYRLVVDVAASEVAEVEQDAYQTAISAVVTEGFQSTAGVGVEVAEIYSRFVGIAGEIDSSSSEFDSYRADFATAVDALITAAGTSVLSMGDFATQIAIIQDTAASDEARNTARSAFVALIRANTGGGRESISTTALRGVTLAEFALASAIIAVEGSEDQKAMFAMFGADLASTLTNSAAYSGLYNSVVSARNALVQALLAGNVDEPTDAFAAFVEQLTALEDQIEAESTAVARLAALEGGPEATSLAAITAQIERSLFELTNAVADAAEVIAERTTAVATAETESATAEAAAATAAAALASAQSAEDAAEMARDAARGADNDAVAALLTAAETDYATEVTAVQGFEVNTAARTQAVADLVAAIQSDIDDDSTTVAQGIVDAIAARATTATTLDAAIAELSTAIAAQSAAMTESTAADAAVVAAQAVVRDAMVALTAAESAHTSATRLLAASAREGMIVLVAEANALLIDTGRVDGEGAAIWENVPQRLSRALRQADEDGDGVVDVETGSLSVELINAISLFELQLGRNDVVLAQNNTLLTSLNRASAANTAAIARNSRAIASNAARISALEVGLQGAKGGIASAIAMSGLPAVTEGFELTVSGGSYDGETGLAVGLHFMVADDVALGFNLGQDGSGEADPSFNVGVTIGF